MIDSIVKTESHHVPFDVQFFDSNEMLRIESEFGFKGLYIASRVHCMVYQKGYYYEWNEFNGYRFSKSLGVGIGYNLVHSVVKAMAKAGYFNPELFKDFGVLTNLALQKYWLKTSKKVSEEFIEGKFRLLEDDRIPFYKIPGNERLRFTNQRLWNETLLKLFSRDNYTCQYCGSIGGKLEADHITPFSKGGSDDLDNLNTSCRSCNRQKKDKSLAEFLIWKEARND